MIKKYQIIYLVIFFLYLIGCKTKSVSNARWQLSMGERAFTRVYDEKNIHSTDSVRTPFL